MPPGSQSEPLEGLLELGPRRSLGAGGGFPKGDGASEEVLDMTGEVMSWSPMGEVDPRNARIERRMDERVN